ncbi:hypothetical protein, partial [Oceanicoccus sp.]|uniref:hypothetical protein n=1 Tax=Oceanicoccus sp. TaxID=2691044 RepID=UPI002626B0EF
TPLLEVYSAHQGVQVTAEHSLHYFNAVTGGQVSNLSLNDLRVVSLMMKQRQTTSWKIYQQAQTLMTA